MYLFNKIKLIRTVESLIAQQDGKSSSSGASTEGAREEKGKRRENGAIIHVNDLRRLLGAYKTQEREIERDEGKSEA